MIGRREYLAVLAAALAGCSASRSDGTPDDPPSQSPVRRTPTATARATATDRTTTGRTTPTGTGQTTADRGVLDPEPASVRQLPADGPAVAWRVQTSEPITSPPAVRWSGRVYVTTAAVSEDRRTARPTDGRGRLLALDAGDGEGVWQVGTPRPAARPLADGDGVAVVTGEVRGLEHDQRVRSFRSDGHPRWVSEDRERALSLLESTGDRLYAATFDDQRGDEGEQLVALDGDGRRDWSIEVGDPVGVTVLDGALLYNASGRSLSRIDLRRGRTTWTVEQEPLGDSSTVVAHDDARGLCYTTPTGRTAPGSVVARSVADGRRRWEWVPPDGFVPTDATPIPRTSGRDAGASVAVTGFDGTVVGLAEGERVWRYQLGGRSTGTLLGEHLYAADRSGAIHALAPTGERRWRTTAPGRSYVRPIEAGLLVVSDAGDGDLLLSLRPDGSRRWRYDPDGEVRSVRTDGTRVVVARRHGIAALDVRG